MVDLLSPTDVLMHMKSCLSALDSMGYASSAALLSQAIYQIEERQGLPSNLAFSSISEIDRRVDFAILDDFMDRLHHT